MRRGIKITDNITTIESESLRAYFKEVSKIKMFATKEDEYDCALKAFNGDEDAIRELTTKNLRFVISVAKKYVSHNASLGDLINEGNIGLQEAAKRFDPDQGVKFISYGVWYIRKEIMLYLSNLTNTIKLPSNKLNKLPKFKEAINTLTQGLGREVEISELLDNIDGFTEKEIENLLEISKIKTSSMDKVLRGVSHDGDTLHDVLISTDMPDTDSLIIDTQKEELFNNLLSSINPIQEKVVRMYYGIGYEYGRNLEEIGIELEVSRERVRQIKEKGLIALRIKTREIGVGEFSF